MTTEKLLVMTVRESAFYRAGEAMGMVRGCEHAAKALEEFVKVWGEDRDPALLREFLENEAKALRNPKISWSKASHSSAATRLEAAAERVPRLVGKFAYALLELATNTRGVAAKARDEYARQVASVPDVPARGVLARLRGVARQVLEG